MLSSCLGLMRVRWATSARREAECLAHASQLLAGELGCGLGGGAARLRVRRRQQIGELRGACLGSGVRGRGPELRHRRHLPSERAHQCEVGLPQPLLQGALFVHVRDGVESERAGRQGAREALVRAANLVL